MDLLSQMRSLGTQPSMARRACGAAYLPVRCGAESSQTISRVRVQASSQDKSVPAIDKVQQQWKPPAMVDPIIDEIIEDKVIVDLGNIATDASLYILKEENEDGTTRNHSVLRMPSKLPEVLGITRHSSNVLNILMVDVSGSMTRYWKGVQDGWNSLVAPNLMGRTVIYTFGSSVVYRRSGTNLEGKDFDAGGTDLTGALQTVVNEVHLCKEKYVNVFLIADGDHNTTGVEPSTVIDFMQSPHNKICNVYILGIGNEFPVQYSVDIRSRLHSGSSNVPSLFWSKNEHDTIEQMTDINEKMCDGSSYEVKLGVAGSVLPGLDTKDTFHLMELVYLPYQPEELKNLKIIFRNCVGFMDLELQNTTIDILREIFRQWNSVIIQLHSKKEAIPAGILDLKERLFKMQLKTIVNGSNSIEQRKLKKDVKKEELEFRKEVHQIRTVITTEKFKDQLELADNILSTTVTKPKYQIKSLQLKGHTDEEFEKDRLDFIEVHNQNAEQLRTLSVTADESCRVTITSTVSDLQDPDFVQMLMESDKFNFLKTFAITGIPVLSPTRDSVTLNPWSYSVQGTLNSPYTIMSQSAMESFADMQSAEGPDKYVQLKDDDDDSRYNAVVPVFSPNVAKAMQPFVRTRLYTMCVNFAILKNPHIIDFDIHMASLGVTWVWCLYEYHSQPRPEHVQIRMESIEATAMLYMDQKRYANYGRVLAENPHHALMTESNELVENKPIKCETLIKPMFFLNMMKKYNGVEYAAVDTAKTIELLLMEYIGRCLSSYKSGDNQSKPYCDFFTESLDDQDKRKDWVNRHISDIKVQMSGNEESLLSDYYTRAEVSKRAVKLADNQVVVLKEDLKTNIPLKVNILKVNRLRNVSTAGDLSWSTLKAFANEMGLSKELIDRLFSEESVFVYTAHALKYRASRDRLSKPIENYIDSHKFVSKKVQEESTRDVIKLFRKELVSCMENAWLKAYLDVHSELVKPMTRQEVISEAQRRGIEVTDVTFDQVYINFRSTGLLSNACQTKACPFYLMNDKSYGQHASVERTTGGQDAFVHGLHKVIHQYQNSDLRTIVREASSGRHARSGSSVPEHTVTKLASQIERTKLIYQEIDHSNSIVR